MNKKILNRIRTLEDLRDEKFFLRKKIAKRRKKIEKRFVFLKEEASASRIFSETVGSTGGYAELIPIVLPLLLKFKENIINSKFVQNLKTIPRKRIFLYSLLGLGTAVSGVFLYRKFRRKSQNDSFEYFNK